MLACLAAFIGERLAGVHGIPRQPQHRGVALPAVALPHQRRVLLILDQLLGAAPLFRLVVVGLVPRPDHRHHDACLRTTAAAGLVFHLGRPLALGARLGVVAYHLDDGLLPHVPVLGALEREPDPFLVAVRIGLGRPEPRRRVVLRRPADGRAPYGNGAVERGLRLGVVPEPELRDAADCRREEQSLVTLY